MGTEPTMSRTLGEEVLGARAVARLARVAEIVLTDLNLSLSQYRLLAFLSTGGTSAAFRIADDMTVTRPSVTALIDGAVARGLVVRHADPDDRRRVSLQITKEGARLLAEADRLIAVRLADLASHLISREMERACEGLALWSKARDLERASRAADTGGDSAQRVAT